MKKMFLSLILSLFVVMTYSQGRICPMSLDLNAMQTQNPSRYQRFINLENFTSNYINNQSGATYRLSDPNGLIVIPVVVHVLHRNEAVGTGLNISLAQIQSQIDVLNEDFRRLNANRINTPGAFVGMATDYNFEFRLACQDPNGNPSNGVTRKYTNKSGFQSIFNADGLTINDTAMGIKMTSMSGEDPWPTDRYLNMWVCNFTDGTLGYGTWPADFVAAPNFDGVVISTTSMGRTGNVTAPYDGGRSATHEVGHWLNLRHIWGDAFCGDDLVADTPVQQDRNFGCPTFPLTVANPAMRWFGPRCNAADPSSMFMNYMDYTDDNCMNLFTNGQRLRGRAIFAAGGPRAAFLDNYFRIQAPAVAIRCSEPIRLFNPNCLPTTWTIVSGPATFISTSETQAILRATGVGSVSLRATAGNYITEATVSVNNFSPLLAGTNTNGTLVRFTEADDPDVYYNSICKGITTSIKMTTEGGSGAWQRVAASPSNTYWKKSGSGLNTIDFYLYGVNQTVTFRYSASNACGTTAQHYSFKSRDCQNPCTQYSVSPNPSSSEVVVNIPAPAPNIPAPCGSLHSIEASPIEGAKVLNEPSVVLLDSNGKVIKERSFEKGSTQVRFSTSDLKEGIYYIRISRAGEIETHRIQVSR